MKKLREQQSNKEKEGVIKKRMNEYEELMNE
jgi:hypothetical protein